MNELTTTKPEDDASMLLLLQSSLYPGASFESIKMVLSYCRAAKLDPMQKPVHIVPMWDNKAGQMRDVVMPGIGMYRTQASRSGEFAGVTEPEFGDDVTEDVGGQRTTYPKWCRVTVRRILKTGSIAEFTAREFWCENYTVKGGKDKSIAPNAMWTKRPYGQLAKCAQAQALRLAFPELGSAPAAEEMEGKQLDAPEIIEAARLAELPTYSDDEFATKLPQWQKAIAGGATADAVIQKLGTKMRLTEDQKVALRKKPKPPAARTYAERAEAIKTAPHEDAAMLELDSARDLPADQQADLKALFDRTWTAAA